MMTIRINGMALPGIERLTLTIDSLRLPRTACFRSARHGVAVLV
jgi:hypothetical protein